MASQIRITPDQMRERAGQYRTEADTVNGVITKMDSLLQALQGEWEGGGKRILCGSLYGIKTGIPESGRVDQRDRGSIRLHSQDRGRDRQQHCKSVPWIVRKSRFKGSSG